MAHTLDLSTRKKEVFTFIFPDGQTKLFILIPDKALFSVLMQKYNTLKNINETDDQALDELYSICATLMSRNQQGIKITAKNLEKQLDFEEVLVFFNEYVKFIGTITNAKN